MSQEPEPQPGHVRTTSAAALAAFAVVGLVLGWSVRPAAVRIHGVAPVVPWLQVLALYFVAAIVAAVSFLTWRSLHRRHERLEPHQAVNRLVLGKACALAGAAVGSGYLGYALAFLGRTEAALARERAVHAGLAGVGGLLLMVAALTLERACRIQKDDDPDLR